MKINGNKVECLEFEITFAEDHKVKVDCDYTTPKLSIYGEDDHVSMEIDKLDALIVALQSVKKIMEVGND